MMTWLATTQPWSRMRDLDWGFERRIGFREDLRTWLVCVPWRGYIGLGLVFFVFLWLRRGNMPV